MLLSSASSSLLLLLLLESSESGMSADASGAMLIPPGTIGRADDGSEKLPEVSDGGCKLWSLPSLSRVGLVFTGETGQVGAASLCTVALPDGCAARIGSVLSGDALVGEGVMVLGRNSESCDGRSCCRRESAVADMPMGTAEW